MLSVLINRFVLDIAVNQTSETNHYPEIGMFPSEWIYCFELSCVKVTFHDQPLISYINGYKVAWRKIKRRIWNISPRTHNNLVSNVTDNIDTLIETQMVRFIFNSINHSNNTCKNILRVKLLSVNSTFAANYQYLSYKYGLIEADWFTPLGHLLGKVKKKMLLLHPHPVLCGILMELCGIRDNTSSCDIANNNDIVALINDICTSN